MPEGQNEVDLTNCDREPIRIPGAVQPHGALIAVCSSRLCVTHASANLARFYGIGAEEALGRPLSDLFEPSDFAKLEETISRLADEDVPGYLFTLRPRLAGEAFDAIVHRAGGCLILEVEPAVRADGRGVMDLYRATQNSFMALARAGSLAEMYQVCARRVRELSGFDRVMVYRFDDEWNGVVVAEERRGDLESFVGHHYPASDIPSQARELYARNWLRFIADRDYAPVPILPPSGPGSPEPLDLGHAVLRSVSPIHVEYLRNMGVGASMSISLLKEGRLWGLVACHHYSPRYVPYDVRTACEILGQVMSMQFVSREAEEEKGYGERMRAVRRSLADRASRAQDVGLALTEMDPTLLDFIEAGGAAVVLGGSVSRVGLTPASEDVLHIRDRLGATVADDVFATDRLGPTMGLDAQGAVAAGLLAVRLAKDDWVMWFRPEQVREVDWAGDPRKSVTKGEGEARLSPRGSFALWKEVVRGRGRPWAANEAAAAADLRRDLVDVLLSRASLHSRENQELRRGDVEKEATIASERAARSAAERMSRLKDEFVATLSHELRTPLNAIVGWTQILRRTKDAETVGKAGEVIERNARAQVNMIEDLLDVSRIASGKLRLDVQPLDLGGVLAAAVDTIAPAAEAKGVRIDRLFDSLADVAVSGDAVRLQQVFWNLLSNAVKFTPRDGRIQVLLERVNSHVEVSVSDSGQGIEPEFLPHLFDRFRQEDASSNRRHGGLGLGLSIVRHVVELHGGTVYARSEGAGKGSVFVVSLPVRAVSRASRPGAVHPTRSDGSGPDPEPGDMLDLSGVRLLILDDEEDARGMMRRVFEDCRAEVETAGSAEEAIEAYRLGEFDVVVSDIGMPGVDGFEFMKRLRKLEVDSGRPRTPAVALTAYARPEDRRRVLLSGYQIHVAKPVEPAEIVAVAANLAGRI
ncbi:ATP-binding protein [Paludisphaera soli]|uniref:ATP-binding protein n=1 Tax=Paludisphaera soli TaxID=2712865 RepID=UPI0013ECC030|nr:ATP-binding protein [Paludisphaera soli]